MLLESVKQAASPSSEVVINKRTKLVPLFPANRCERCGKKRFPISNGNHSRRRVGCSGAAEASLVLPPSICFWRREPRGV